MKRGAWYKVTKPFEDADGDMHPEGESWQFMCSMFSRYEDELSLFVRTHSVSEWKFSLVWKPEQQQDIIENFSDYVEECDPNSRT